MKKVILSILSIALYATSVNSATYMFVKKIDNQFDKYDVEDVKEVKYEEETTSEEGTIDNYSYVDLGLPSKIKWATCNVGASAPTEYGDHFAWGEISAKSSFTMSNSKMLDYSPKKLTKYGIIDDVKDVVDKYSLGNLTSKYDAATANWSGSWRMPTLSDFNELITKCKWEWTKMSNVEGDVVKGYEVTGPNGKSIFIPASGYDNGYSSGSNGQYWSSTASSYLNNNDDSYCYAYCLFLYNDWFPWKYSGRETGGSIRPVSDSNTFMVVELADGKTVKYNLKEIKKVTYGETEVESDGKIGDYDYIDLGLPSGIKWATCNVGASVPEGFGDYFAWGETKTKEKYSNDNSEWFDVSVDDLLAKGVIDAVKDSSSKYAEGRLTAQYDVATANWGETWRMPTLDEVDELQSKCKWVWITIQDNQGNNVSGYEVTGPNGKSMFIPAASYDNGYYWASTAYSDNKNAIYMKMSSSTYEWWYTYRSSGCSVRPVSK